MVKLHEPHLMTDSNGKRHVFFITTESGENYGNYIARGSEQPTGNRYFISPPQNTIEEAVAYARKQIVNG